MRSFNSFIDAGSDDAVLQRLGQSVAHPEELAKSMNKAGLVQKEVQVKGKNGQTFTRKQWVKASEDQSNPQPAAKQEDEGGQSKSISFETNGKPIKQVLAGLLQNGASRNDLMSAAKAQGVEWKPCDHEGINWMRASMAIQKHFGGSTQQGTEQSDGKPQITRDEHVVGKTMQDVENQLKDKFGITIDSADKSSPDKVITLYGDNKTEYKADYTKYSNGDIEVSNVRPNKNSDTKDNAPAPANGGNDSDGENNESSNNSKATKNPYADMEGFENYIPYQITGITAVMDSFDLCKGGDGDLDKTNSALSDFTQKYGIHGKLYVEPLKNGNMCMYAETIGGEKKKIYSFNPLGGFIHSERNLDVFIRSRGTTFSYSQLDKNRTEAIKKYVSTLSPDLKKEAESLLPKRGYVKTADEHRILKLSNK